MNKILKIIEVAKNKFKTFTPQTIVLLYPSQRNIPWTEWIPWQKVEKVLSNRQNFWFLNTFLTQLVLAATKFIIRSLRMVFLNFVDFMTQCFQNQNKIIFKFVFWTSSETSKSTASFNFFNCCYNQNHIIMDSTG